jgi:hypothetical protein
MTNDPHVEILAQGIWLEMFGVTALQAPWIEWSKANPAEAGALRARASEMIGVAKAQAGKPVAHGSRTSHNHSLGWLFS